MFDAPTSFYEQSPQKVSPWRERAQAAAALHQPDEVGLCVECRQGAPCDTLIALGLD